VRASVTRVLSVNLSYIAYGYNQLATNAKRRSNGLRVGYRSSLMLLRDVSIYTLMELCIQLAVGLAGHQHKSISPVNSSGNTWFCRIVT